MVKQETRKKTPLQRHSIHYESDTMRHGTELEALQKEASA
jgi:hypothetical protein